MERLLELMHDCFYRQPKLTEQRKAIKDCYEALKAKLGKAERRLLLQLIDDKDSVADLTSLDSFIAGFQLAWRLSQELNNYKSERLADREAERPGARFLFTEEDKK